MFYMLWLFLYYQKAVNAGNLFYNGSPKSMLLTLVGMDGYLSYRYPQNYYLIGEWFLGALVLLYLLYPLLTLCMKHCKLLTTLLLGGGTVSLLWLQPHFLIQRERNLVVCLFAFWLGMLFIEYRAQLSALWITVVFGGAALFLLLVKVPLDGFLCAQLIALGLFLLFYQIGCHVMRYRLPKKFFAYTGKISYAIFLLQHVVMSQILGLFNAYSLTVSMELLILLATFVVIYIFADVSTRLKPTLPRFLSGSSPQKK
jgi:peptidoglycan/LPS O-acetylase OafA/YrhL